MNERNFRGDWIVLPLLGIVAVVVLWATDRKTALMVTHDVDEALFLSDRVVLLSEARSLATFVTLRWSCDF